MTLTVREQIKKMTDVFLSHSIHYIDLFHNNSKNTNERLRFCDQVSLSNPFLVEKILINDLNNDSVNKTVAD